MADSPDEILARAEARGRAKNLPYFGEVTPQEAWALAQAGSARIVDVRTLPEWQYVGHIPGSELIQWRAYGAEAADPAGFVAALGKHASAGDAVMLLCRSAVRSHAAATAAAAAGFTRALNILEGFEGDIDADGHRGNVGGWRKAGLPWKQS